MERRPDPDELLARVNREEEERHRGRLKIFFGSAPGVGKTYAMLGSSRLRKSEGIDVVIGWAETHGRAETAALLEGQEILLPLLLSYRGKELREFDLDGALERKPALILVDELAHTNAPGSRHAKRWQDVQELLAAGIDVYTTLNVQHIESLNGVVAQITGVSVAERIPDSVFEQADEVELVDLPADELIQRMKEGKVYFPQVAEQALGSFFRPGNLIALRELALRRTADRVDVQMQRYRMDHAVGETWPTAERVLVCLGPSPYGQHLVRSARLLASRLKAEWIALYVENSHQGGMAPSDREQLERTLRLAEQLGGKAVTLTAENTAEEILAFARARNVSKILLGKPPRAGIWRILRRDFVSDLIRESGGIDVYIMGGTAEERLARIRSARRPKRRWAPYLYGLAVVAAASALSALLKPYVEPVNLAMIYLLGVAVVATRLGVGPSILASIASVALFDFLFVPPYLTFAVGDSQYLITFVVMTLVALLISTLAARARLQAERARAAQSRTEALADLTQQLARARDSASVAAVAVRHLSEQYEAQSAVFLPDGSGDLCVVSEFEASFAARTSESSVARWVFDHGEPAGLDTDTLPGSDALYLPLIASGETLGVVGIRPQQSTDEMMSEVRHRVESVVGQTALALERTALAERARQAQVEAEAERLRSGLLSSVSHDFRTPLASIVGASSAIATGDLDASEVKELGQSIYDESQRLSRFVANLLDMTRLESGALAPARELQPIEEVIGAALGRVKARLAGRVITLRLPEALPLVGIDARLMEQVFINLLENVARHTPEGTPVEITGAQEGKHLVVRVDDHGPGLRPGTEEKVFEKFFRSSEHSESSGLGLAICHAIVTAHSGAIRAASRPGGGATFTVTLPVAEVPAGPDGAPRPGGGAP
jgi:two-component system, OmpR family, sensor histidine kinase KdpD